MGSIDQLRQLVELVGKGEVQEIHVSACNATFKVAATNIQDP
jgi:hypothetical protein